MSFALTVYVPHNGTEKEEVEFKFTSLETGWLREIGPNDGSFCLNFVFPATVSPLDMARLSNTIEERLKAHSVRYDRQFLAGTEEEVPVIFLDFFIPLKSASPNSGE